MHIKIGTRGSRLALAQANIVVDRLRNAFPEHEYELVIIKTTGDIELDKPLDAMGSKGIFVDRIEQALLKNEIQIAVHSMKDMPSELRSGLIFTKAWRRDDPRDVIIFKNVSSINDLPRGANVATGSKRRSYQLLQIRPDIRIVPIRGNIDTRIKKLHEDEGLDAIILAAAGLNRLGIKERYTHTFSVDEMIPSPSQGTLAIEVAENNTEIIEMLNSLSDEYTDKCTYLERGFLEKIGGDCHLPIGAYACKENDEYVLRALFGNEDGSRLARAVVHGKSANVELINTAVMDINRQLEEQ